MRERGFVWFHLWSVILITIGGRWRCYQGPEHFRLGIPSDTEEESKTLHVIHDEDWFSYYPTFGINFKISLSHLFHILNVLIGTYIFKPTTSILKKIFCNDMIHLTFHFYCLSCYSYVQSYKNLSDNDVPCPQCTVALPLTDVIFNEYSFFD